MTQELTISDTAGEPIALRCRDHGGVVIIYAHNAVIELDRSESHRLAGFIEHIAAIQRHAATTPAKARFERA